MRSICVATFCYWNNYGSIFQALGLKCTLERIGYSSFIVQPEPKEKAQPNYKFPSLRVLISKEGVRYLHSYFIKKKTMRLHTESQQFIDKYLYFQYYRNYNELKENPPYANLYLAGSDQIWNPRRCLPFCFLDFVPNNAPRLSYAPSMGVLDIPDAKRDIFIQYINSFNSLSVREKDNAEIIKSVTGRNCEVHMDPSLLLTVDEWRKYEQPRNVKKPFILVYALYWERRFNKLKLRTCRIA